MKRICIRCNRTSTDGNLWCQEKYCPAEKSPEIFERGEWLGDIEIVELLTVLRSAAIYKAKRGRQDILLKVAHEGCQEKLKREAKLLLELAGVKHPMLPVLLPAFAQARLQDLPYGKTVVQGCTRYFLVFEFVDGDTLRNLLLKNPQPWYQHAGWIALGLADVITLFHQRQRLHLCLSPDIVLVRLDKQGIPRIVLLDMGFAGDVQSIERAWDRRFVPPAYTAPELVEMKGKVGAATDVYGLGLVLYEMLAGHPAIEFRQERDENVYTAVLKSQPPATGRADLKNIPAIAERAISKDYTSRQPSPLHFAQELQANLPRIPREKKEFQIPWRAIAIVVGTLLALSLLLVLAVVLGEETQGGAQLLSAFI